MKLCIISDTHGKHKQLTLPNADVIIHCGDMTPMGREHEVHNFMKWFSGLEQYKYRICIAGNHDWIFELNHILAMSLIPSNVIYLEDTEIVIDDVKFYGTPVQKPFMKWAFNRPEEKLEHYWGMIPDDTDVLITHSPPYMIGDMVKWDRSHQGSPSLYKEVIERIHPNIHCFGHIHEGNGIRHVDDVTFINASNLDEHYDCIFSPVVIEI